MFVYKEWEKFCKQLNEDGFNSVNAASVEKTDIVKPFFIMKHDVETNPIKALKLAEIESKYGHSGSYYVQGYLMKNKKNLEILKRIQDLGHEVSYHHDVMDSNKGDILKAKVEFEKFKNIFEENGFLIKTVCQHGNPIIEREGYFSNRDFFRDNTISNFYENISEIMVNYKTRIQENYLYISDAGYGWKVIFDPENNDVINSDDKNISLNDLKAVAEVIKNGESVILSTHPHRWESNVNSAKSKDYIFRKVKIIAKLLMAIPFFKKIMSKFYFLAKRI